jgi:hypothetical protein
LAQALAHLIYDRQLREDFGRRGRAFVIKDYAKERLLADISALYGELFHREPARLSGLKPDVMLE